MRDMRRILPDGAWWRTGSRRCRPSNAAPGCSPTGGRPWGPLFPPAAGALEIGGGCGNFIGELWRQGRFASAALVESCAAHLDFARDRFAGLTCASTLDELETGSFDILFLLHVFEHLTDPVGAARHFARLLAPGGRICLEVPCAADPLLSLYGCAAYKDFYFQPMHPFVHCQDSLRVAFGEAGFVARAFLPVQRYPLSNHAEWLARGRPGGNPSLARIFGEETESAYKRATGAQRHGGHPVRHIRTVNERSLIWR